jgi:hypothetical protein
MGNKVKFATQIDEKVLKDLKKYVDNSEQSISSIVSLAIAEYIDRARLRPAFRDAMEEVMEEHAELLDRLAK